MCAFPACVTEAHKACCVVAALLCKTCYPSVYHTLMKTQMHCHTHTDTSRPLLPSCEGFDIRLPAADAANANAAESSKLKTAANMTQRRVKLQTAEELQLVR